MEEEEKQKTARERVEDFIQGAQSARNLTRLGRGGNGQAVRGAATAARLLLTNPFGIAIIIAIVIIFLMTTVFSFISVGSSELIATPTPSTVRANIKFRCQYDTRWTQPNSCNIASVGCDPTALSIILSSFGDSSWDPLSVALTNNIGCTVGTTIPQIESSVEWTKTLGYLVAKENLGFERNFELRTAKKFINAGYLLLGVANITFETSSPVKSGGHSFVITDVDPSLGNLTVLDPTYCTSDDNFRLRTLNVNDVICTNSDCGWYYVHAIKKL